MYTVLVSKDMDKEMLIEESMGKRRGAGTRVEFECSSHESVEQLGDADSGSLGSFLQHQ